MSFDLDWLDKKEPEKKEIKLGSRSPGPNEIKKLRRENKELKQKYGKLKHHELTRENLINYFMGIKQAKLYELVRFFDLNAAHEIEKLVKELVKEGIIRIYKNGWHRINPSYKIRKREGGN